MTNVISFPRKPIEKEEDPVEKIRENFLCVCPNDLEIALHAVIDITVHLLESTELTFIEKKRVLNTMGSTIIVNLS